MTLHIQLIDREGALERLLGTCRRRGLRLLALNADAAESGLRLRVTLDLGTTDPSRALALLHRIHDIQQITPIDHHATAHAA